MYENYPMIHYVTGDDFMPFGVNAHTHGLDKYNQLELECILPYSQEDMGALLNMLSGLVIEDGRHLEDGCYNDILADNYRLAFVEVPDHYDESDKPKKVLRIIFPDNDGNLPWESHCEEHYAAQTFDIPDECLPLWAVRD